MLRAKALRSVRESPEERTLDAHGLSSLDDALDADLLTDTYGYGVDASGEGTAQCQRVTGECAVELMLRAKALRSVSESPENVPLALVGVQVVISCFFLS